METQDIKNKKRSLKKYRNNLACINRLEEKLIVLNNRINSVRSPNYSGMPRGGTPVTLEDLISDKTDLERRIKRLKDKGKSYRNQILDEIDTLDDVRYCEVLEGYFIRSMSISEIAEEMGYTDRHVYELYKQGVYELTINADS